MNSMKTKSAALLGSFGMGLIFSLVGTWALTHILSLEDYGYYTYFFSWILLFAVIGDAGLPTLCMREAASIGQPRLRTFMLWVLSRVSVFSLLSALVFYPVAIYTLEIPLMHALFGSGLILLVSFNQILASIINGLNRVLEAQIPEKVVRPGVVMMIALAMVLTGRDINATAGLAIGAAGIVVIFLFYSIRNLMIYNSSQSGEKSASWNQSLWFFLGLSIVTTLNSKLDILMLGVLMDAEAVGLYSIAVRLSEFVAIGLVILNPLIGPSIVELFEKNHSEALNQMLTRFARFYTGIGIMIFGIVALFSVTLLGIFGREFVRGENVLIILGCAQLVNLVVGSVGLILNMTGHERSAFRAMLMAVVLNAGLNLVLIPSYGIEGAAIATAVGWIFWNITMWAQVRKRTKLKPSVFGSW